MASYPTDWETMREVLRTWVAGELGGTWTVIWSDQDAPRAPDKPFARLKAVSVPVSEGDVRPETVSVSDDQMDILVRSSATFTFGVQLFGDTDVRTTAENLRLSLVAPSVREQLRAAGLVPIDEVAFVDLSQIFAGRREWRYSLDLRMRIERARTFTAQPWIETVTPTVVEVSQ